MRHRYINKGSHIYLERAKSLTFWYFCSLDSPYIIPPRLKKPVFSASLQEFDVLFLIKWMHLGIFMNILSTFGQQSIHFPGLLFTIAWEADIKFLNHISLWESIPCALILCDRLVPSAVAGSVSLYASPGRSLHQCLSTFVRRRQTKRKGKVNANLTRDRFTITAG